MERLGGKEVIPVKCRIIATTNRDPIQLIREGKFREDLYYRLNVFRIECLPLKGREKAIQVLVEQFVDQLSEKHGLTHKSISPGGMDLLKSYPWPGNIRELQNVLERALLTTDHDALREDDFLFSSSLESKPHGENLSDIEERHILSILQSVGGSQTKAADKLGITTRTLRNKMKIYSGKEK
jgi:two-component system response regulator AtoC